MADENMFVQIGTSSNLELAGEKWWRQSLGERRDC